MLRREIAIPETFRGLARGEAFMLVRKNEVSELTFEVGKGLQRRFIKWAPAGSGLAQPALTDLAE
jgi:kanamycin kinase